MMFASVAGAHPLELWSENMGEVVRFVPKSDLERARLIRQARAIYDSIFPQVDQVSDSRDPKP